MALTIRPKQECRWDLVSLGEVMLRFDPGDGRISTTRHFDVCEGGGEYNVARGLKRCFGISSTREESISPWCVGLSTTALVMPRETVSISLSAVSECGLPSDPTIV